MNNKIVIGIVAALLLGLGVYFYTNQMSPTAMKDAMMAKTGSGMETVSGTMKDLMSKGSKIQCTFEQTVDQTSSKGTVYISGDKMRGNFESMVNGTSMMTSMIRDGEYMYTWSDEDKKGTKMRLDAIEEQAMAAKDAMPEANDPVQGDMMMSLENQNVDYSCKPWNEDATVFAIPTDVTFTDISAQMEKMNKQIEGMKSTQCAACDQLPAGPAQDQCKTSLGCN